jgi:UDP-N-acetylglucosamine transferase subunit ALG13
MYRQYAEWPGYRARGQSRWSFAGSIFDAFEPETGGQSLDTHMKRLLVTLGTIPYPFQRLIATVQAAAPVDCEITWQLGATPADGVKRGEVHQFISADRLAEMCASSDVVVSHAGVGSAFVALSAGKLPVLLARDSAAGEHVDNHQAHIADMLSRKGLAITAKGGGVSSSDLVAGSRGRVRVRETADILNLSRLPWVTS